MAAKYGNANIMDFLIERGADVDHTNNRGQDVRYFAVKSGHSSVESCLDRHHVSPEYVSDLDYRGYVDEPFVVRVDDEGNIVAFDSK